MSNMTDACKAKLSDIQKDDLQWRITWIAGREYYRTQKDLEKMALYDDIASRAYPDHGFSDANPQLNEYLLRLSAGIVGHLPGWNDVDCSFDQTMYACFASWLSGLTAEEREAELAAMAAGTPPDGESCDTTMVMKDPVYISAYPPNVDAASSKGKWWLLLLGIGSVAVVGAIAFAGRQEKYDKGNPAGSKYDSGADIAQIAKLVRKDITAAIKEGKLPDIGTSVRVERYSGGRRLTVEVVKVPGWYRIFHRDFIQQGDSPSYRGDRYSSEARATLRVLQSIVGAYNRDDSDSMTDYYNVHFSEYVQFDHRLLDSDRARAETEIRK